MNLFLPKLTLSTLLAWCAYATTGFAQATSASKTDSGDAVLLTLEGKVEVSPAGATAWTAGRTNQTLHTGDRLRTALRSRATVRLANLSVLRVNELTTLQIQAPSAPGKQSLLDLKAGATYLLSRERPGELEFRTPTASGAIRGTEFHLAVADDGRSVVTLLDGAIVLNNPQGSLELASGEQATIEPGQAPVKTAVLNAINVIQWCLYYPGVLDADEAGLSAEEQSALADSLAAYRSGDLLGALAKYPETRQPASAAEKVYQAALLLAVGQAAQAESRLSELAQPSPLADALREVIGTVKGESWSRAAPAATATEWLAESYYHQSRSKLAEALEAARNASGKSPNFGFAWARVAELEFSFGRVPAALAVLEKSLHLSPRNAEALALKGFLLAAQNKIPAAREQFENAIALDGALGNAWLGRGLVRIRAGDANGGRQDLQVAATLEPQRALLRSYLGKAFANARDAKHAAQELALARKLDPNDPTAWLYSALFEQQENQINDAVRDLEKSKELNDNRRVYRSRLLLDQDRAVRSANLAQIYRDDGLDNWSVGEAGRALSSDYANYSAHLFLAESYDALRDPKQINLRYETPWLTELLVSQLLAPVGAGSLSQYVSQQEYSKLFARDGFGLSSSTEYLSTGDWLQRASQFGTFGNTSYALDVEYRSESGQRPNNDLMQTTVYAKLKHQFTPQDSVFFEVIYYNSEFGDVAQYYNQDSSLPGVRAPSPTFRAKEQQSPNLLLGYHHEWGPGSHTLFLAGRLDDTLSYNDPNARIPYYRYTTFLPPRQPFSIAPLIFPIDYEREFEAYTTELQQIWQGPRHTFVAGARYQFGWVDTTDNVTNIYQATTDPITLETTYQLIAKDVQSDLNRFNVYVYDQWQIFDSLLLSAGVSYDQLHYPRNIDTSPIEEGETTVDQVSPKIGLIWSPLPETHLRGAYTRSLGGFSYDASVRLEPTQVAGFNQAYRSIAPESAVGLVPGSEFETFGLALDQAFKKTGTYLGIAGEFLNSDATRTVGVVTNGFDPVPSDPSSTRQSLDFSERTLAVTLNQLVGREWSLGLRYRLSFADLDGQFIDIPPTFNNPVSGQPQPVAGLNLINQDESATLNQLNFFAIYSHPSGFFGRFESIWTQQSNRGYTPEIPGDEFWQFNLYAGYRFWHRAAEVRLGLLNIGDQDYRLNPLNLYNELPRERTLSVLFKFYF